MAIKIISIKIKNYKVLRNIHLTDLPDLAVFVGANGSGKSTLFDLFAFLRDALLQNVRYALQIRGGFKEVVSRGSNDPIEIEIVYRLPQNRSPITYYLAIRQEIGGMPFVLEENLVDRIRTDGNSGYFLKFSHGQGLVSTLTDQDEMVLEQAQLDSPDILAIKGLGFLKRFPVVAEFRQFIENWHVADLHLTKERLQHSGYAEHLSGEGENLALVAHFIYKNHRAIFATIVHEMTRRVPGITDIKVVETEDKRVLLKFKDGSFRDLFSVGQVSDGTLKMLAYLILLHDPTPHPLLCMEEPENQLYPDLLTELAEEFRLYAQRGGQMFVSTHSPTFLNAIKLDEVFWMVKEKGFTRIERARDHPLLLNLAAEGDPPGALWSQQLFTGVFPRCSA